MRKIAIPIDANGILNKHFGHSPYFLIAIINNNNEVKKKEIISAPPHEPGLLPQWMNELKVTHILASGIGQKAIDLLEEKNIKVEIGAPIMDSTQLLTDFLNGQVDFSTNLCDH